MFLAIRTVSIREHENYAYQEFTPRWKLDIDYWILDIEY